MVAMIQQHQLQEDGKDFEPVVNADRTCCRSPIPGRQFVNPTQTILSREDGLSCDDPEAQDAIVPDGEGSRPQFDPQKPEEDNKVFRWCEWMLTWRCIALVATLTSCLAVATVISLVLLGRELPPTPTLPVNPDSSIDNDSVRFIERQDWLAQPPTVPLDRLVLPVPYVIISHTATHVCRTRTECTHHVRLAQIFHIEARKFSDIAYNFLVGGDGHAYVGRGWDFVGAHAFGYNSRSIGISFIGTFNTDVPPDSQIHAAQKVIELGVKLGKISADYKLLGHRQVSQTESPGTALYTVLQKWPHWSPMP